MEEQTKTVRFVQNARDTRTNIPYSGGEVKTLIASAADRLLEYRDEQGNPVVVEEQQDPAQAASVRLAEAEKVAAEARRVIEQEEQKSDVREVPVVEVPAPHGLNDLTVQQLKDKAKHEGVDVSGLSTKADLVSALEKKNP